MLPSSLFTVAKSFFDVVCFTKNFLILLVVSGITLPQITLIMTICVVLLPVAFVFVRLLLKLSDLSPDQLMLALGLRSMMRARGLDPQEDVNLKHALPPFLRHATVVRSGKAQVLQLGSCVE